MPRFYNSRTVSRHRVYHSCRLRGVTVRTSVDFIMLVEKNIYYCIDISVCDGWLCFVSGDGPVGEGVD